MKKIVALFMATTVALGTMSVTAFGSVFADIKSVPWPGAATFIDQAQGLGLLNGYDENGKKYAKPRNNVTYSETLQMIYSIMKVNGGQEVSTSDVTKWTPVMTAYNIPSWGYASTVYALENKLIENNDLNKLRNGKEFATREDVGVIFGKALAPQYPVNNSAALSYKDKAKIVPASVPYLALLNSMKIMVGDNVNNFNPKAKINRAEMAVLSVKTYNTLKDSTPVKPPTPTSGTVTGKVINSMVLANGDVFLSMTPTNGTGLNLFGKKGEATVTYEKETVTLADIGTGDDVTITYNGENLKTVVINKSVAGINTKKTFPLDSIASSSLTVKDGSKYVDYRIDRNVVVYVADKKQDIDYLISAKRDAEYNVTLTFDKDNYVTKIEAIKNANNPLTGDLSYLSDTKVSIKVGSKEWDYTLSEGDVAVNYDGKSMRFVDLKSEYSRTNHIVTLKLDSKGYVNAIQVDYREDATHGTLSYMNVRKIELTANGKTYTYDIDEDTTVKIDGKTKDQSDLKDTYENKAYLVAVDVDRDNYCRSIVATSKNASLSKGVLKSLTSSEIKVEVDRKSYTYDLNDPTVKIDGKTVNFTTFKKEYGNYTYDVELSFDSKGKVNAITGKNTDAFKGALKSIETGRDEITITAAGVDYKYTLSSSVEATLSNTSISLSRLDEEIDYAKRNNETVNVTLTMSGSKVSKIAAKISSGSSSTSSKTYELVAIRAYDIRVMDGSSYKDIPLASGSVDVTLDGSGSSVTKLTNEYNSLSDTRTMTVSFGYNSKDEINSIVAKTVYKSDLNNGATKGNVERIIFSSSSSNNDGEITIEGSSAWSVKRGTYVTFSDLGSDYNKSDYTKDLDGLYDFWKDCDRRNDDCYVTLTINSNNTVTDITATDR